MNDLRHHGHGAPLVRANQVGAHTMLAQIVRMDAGPIRRIRQALACMLLAWPLAAGAAIDTQAGELIQALLAADRPVSPEAHSPCYSANMPARLYALRSYQPAWASAKETGLAQQVLAGASEHGLVPAHYRVEPAPGSAAAEPLAQARHDIMLTEAMLRYLADLQCGRVASPLATPFLAQKRAAFDPALHLAQALAGRGLADAVRAAAPDHPLYRRVQGALARYRAQSDRAPEAIPIDDPRPAIRPAQPFAHADALRQRLIQLGDLESSAAPEAAGQYAPELARAVRAFQERHGLPADGILDHATRNALNVPLTRRIRQLELTLERLRWLPRLHAPRMIVVNVPAYRLLAFEIANGQAEQALGMRVIVGKAVRTPTPLFVGELRQIELNPYWNVPRSIERAELLPKLARNPAYLEQQGMEIVAAGLPVPAGQATASALAAVRSGQARIRQRPGPNNALGPMKFVMPNPMNIYLHGTPATELFARSRRDFSHGCIRVEHPAELAEFALAQPGRWPVGAITEAVQTGKTQTLALTAPIPVVLLYATAIVDRGGRVLFFDDIYRLDAELDQALR